MFDSIHWNEKCAERIFNLEITLTKLKMEYSLEREGLLGEICCLKRHNQDLQEQVANLKENWEL